MARKQRGRPLKSRPAGPAPGPHPPSRRRCRAPPHPSGRPGPSYPRTKRQPGGRGPRPAPASRDRPGAADGQGARSSSWIRGHSAARPACRSCPSRPGVRGPRRQQVVALKSPRKARTGNVRTRAPSPERRRSGSPASGRRSRPHRCSAIGMLARSRSAVRRATGIRGVVDVQGVDADERRALAGQPLGAGGGRGRDGPRSSDPFASGRSQPVCSSTALPRTSSPASAEASIPRPPGRSRGPPRPGRSASDSSGSAARSGPSA